MGFGRARGTSFVSTCCAQSSASRIASRRCSRRSAAAASARDAELRQFHSRSRTPEAQNCGRAASSKPSQSRSRRVSWNDTLCRKLRMLSALRGWRAIGAAHSGPCRRLRAAKRSSSARGFSARPRLEEWPSDSETEPPSSRPAVRATQVTRRRNQRLAVLFRTGYALSPSIPMQPRASGLPSLPWGRRCLCRSHQRQIEQFQTALGRVHDLSLHPRGNGVVLDNFQRELWMLVVVVRMFPYPLVRPWVHVHTGSIPVGLETRANPSCDSARNTFYGKARRGHSFCERPLGVHAPHPVGQ